MSSLDELKAVLGSQNQEGIPTFDDKTAHEFEGDNIDDLLEEACHFFNTDRLNLDYNIIQKASSGFLGAFRRPYKVLVWKTGDFHLDQHAQKSQGTHLRSGALQFLKQAEEQSLEENLPVNGSAEVTIRKSGIYLKVTAPRNGGSEVSLSDVQNALSQRAVRNFRANQIKQIIRDASGQDVKIGEWTPNPTCDSQMSLEIAPNKMKAYITITAPILSGRQLEIEEVEDLLKTHDITHGILKEQIPKIFTEKLYNTPILIAEGTEAQHGESAKIHYEFQTDSTRAFFQHGDKDKINYKDITTMQNVVVGTILARKIEATQGTDGCTIHGDKIQSYDGQDIELIAGTNATVSDDGRSIVSQTAGKPLLKDGIVSVEAIHEIAGDVDLNTGSIVFLGVVIVRGNVSDGFTVKAAKNIEIHGNVGNAVVESDADILIKGGIQGKGTGVIKSGRNIVAKFVGNAHLSAGNDVIIKEEIVHSHVEAGKRVICYGKRGTIVGGIIRAGYGISAKFLGSTAYTNTTLEAGGDPKARAKLHQLQKEVTECSDQYDKLALNIQTLQKQQKATKLSEAKQKLLKRFQRASQELELQVQEMQEDIETLENYLANLEIKGIVSAQATVFPGVRISIKSAQFTVKNEYNNSSFIEKNNVIMPKPYQSIADKDTL